MPTDDSSCQETPAEPEASSSGLQSGEGGGSRDSYRSGRSSLERALRSGVDAAAASTKTIADAILGLTTGGGSGRSSTATVSTADTTCMNHTSAADDSTASPASTTDSTREARGDDAHASNGDASGVKVVPTDDVVNARGGSCAVPPGDGDDTYGDNYNGGDPSSASSTGVSTVHSNQHDNNNTSHSSASSIRAGDPPAFATMMATSMITTLRHMLYQEQAQEGQTSSSRITSSSSASSSTSTRSLPPPPLLHHLQHHCHGGYHHQHIPGHHTLLLNADAVEAGEMCLGSYRVAFETAKPIRDLLVQFHTVLMASNEVISNVKCGGVSGISGDGRRGAGAAGGGTLASEFFLGKSERRDLCYSCLDVWHGTMRGYANAATADIIKCTEFFHNYRQRQRQQHHLQREQQHFVPQNQSTDCNNNRHQTHPNSDNQIRTNENGNIMTTTNDDSTGTTNTTNTATISSSSSSSCSSSALLRQLTCASLRPDILALLPSFISPSEIPIAITKDFVALIHTLTSQ